MKRSRREQRSIKRDIAEHNRAVQVQFDFRRLAARITNQATLERAIYGFSGDKRLQVIEALRPHLPFVPS